MQKTAARSEICRSRSQEFDTFVFCALDHLWSCIDTRRSLGNLRNGHSPAPRAPSVSSDPIVLPRNMASVVGNGPAVCRASTPGILVGVLWPAFADRPPIPLGGSSDRRFCSPG